MLRPRILKAPTKRKRSDAGDYPTAAAFLPVRLTLPRLRDAARGCRGCPLYVSGTQTVFGEGPPDARLVLVGEQPGDREDLTGKPFVGPAGAILDRALAESGIARQRVYVTNAVKHFKWRPVGKRRLHQKPRDGEMDACFPWLEAEIRAISPGALVCLGSTAARALVDKSVRVTEMRGRIVESVTGHPALVTVHPSSLLRLPDKGLFESAFRDFVSDLDRARIFLEPDKRIGTALA